LADFWASTFASLGIPYLVFAYGIEVNMRLVGLRGRLLAWSRRRTFSRAAGIVAVSRATADDVARLGVARSRIHVVPPAIDLGDWEPAARDRREEVANSLGVEGKRVLFTVSRLIRRKGISTMIRALPRILQAEPNAVYVVAGSGEEEGALRRLAVDLGLEDRVMFTGPVTEEVKKALYGICEVFVLPCRSLPDGDVEGFGIVFLEAAASGKPAVAGRSGGVVDAVADEETGLLVPPDSPDALAAAVVRVLGDEELARRLGSQGRARARAMTWGASAAKLREIIESVAVG
jgi:phosphatidylinositol alpha-1,6-mannosyltransferase